MINIYNFYVPFAELFQIIRECKDILAKAVLVKQYYQHMIAAVLDDNELAAENSPMDLDKFDDDMSDMFKVWNEPPRGKTNNVVSEQV